MYLGNIYLHCTYIAMNPGILKRNKEDYMGGLGWKKKKGKWCNYIIITKIKRNLKISIKEKHEVTIKLRGAQASQGLYNPIDCDHGLWSWWTTNSSIWEKNVRKAWFFNYISLNSRYHLESQMRTSSRTELCLLEFDLPVSS